MANFGHLPPEGMKTMSLCGQPSAAYRESASEEGKERDKTETITTYIPNVGLTLVRQNTLV